MLIKFRDKSEKQLTRSPFRLPLSAFSIFQLPNSHFRIHLLVAKSILIPAVRTLPGDGVAGHAPDIFVHTFLADIETAATPPAECEVPAAAMAAIFEVSAALAPVAGDRCGFFHGCCFTMLLI